MSDIILDTTDYWRRKCDICKKKYPDMYQACGEDSYKCKADIDVYHER